MIEYVVLAFIGCLLGVVTGLTPGLHVNTVCLMGLGAYQLIGLDAVQFGVAMVSMSITHTFLDYIPGIFIGVPEESTALAVLPSHKLFMKGRALDAIKLTGFGSLIGLFFSVIFLVPAISVLPIIYSKIKDTIIYVVLAATSVLIIRERGIKRKLSALFIFGLSGVLGTLIFQQRVLSPTQILFPVFAGLFGLSGMIHSLNTRPVSTPQKPYSSIRVGKGGLFAGFVGAVGGALVGILPAMSPSQIGILMSGLYGSSVESFLVAVSAINTADAVFSFTSLYTINNPRSGVAVLVGRVMEVDFEVYALFVGVFCFCGFFALFFHMRMGSFFIRFLESIDYQILTSVVVFFVLWLVYFFTSWYGLMVAATSISIGLMPILSGVSRTHLMGVLIIPTAITYIL